MSIDLRTAPQASTLQPLLLRALAGETLARPPVWFMRQAGRFLPEYRALRATQPDFVAFCLNPQAAAEATLQPLRRLPFDAAIVFADILLIPRALGQEVWFEAGEGPRLGPIPSVESLRDQVEGVAAALSPVGETLARVRAELAPERALIGFAGAPWTVLTYMLRGRGGERDEAIAVAYAEPERVDAILEVLVEATARYLAMQARSGAQALQIFESWAEGLAEPLFERLVTRPHASLVARLRALGCDLPLIGFPRGAGGLVEGYAAAVPVNAVGLDTQTPLALGRRLQASGKTLQGCLDPLLLRAGGPALEARVDQLLAGWGDGPWVFNLGHGVIPTTPIPHVAQVLERITGVKATSLMTREGSRKIGVVLFNLGGPDSLSAVKPFLFNLFNDPAIIGLPGPLRWLVARLISSRREKEAQHNYAHMGGASPLLRETEAQRSALEQALAAAQPDDTIKVVTAMRYWRPFTEDVAREMAGFAPDEVVLLPLYPQFSTTTTGSSFMAWRKAYKGSGREHAVCCYPDELGLLDAHAARILGLWDAAGRPADVRVLFSAHGLPERVIERGDPYQWQVERTCAAVAAKLALAWPGLDWSICYQSRVGPLKWIGPSTPDAITAAAQERKGVLLVPIAFVSEHVETLVELDRDYAELAQGAGIPHYLRAPAIGVLAPFIDGLAGAVGSALGREGVQTGCGGRICPADRSACPVKGSVRAAA